MLRTNLSTRPFYNERAIHLGLALAALLVLALTAFNVSRIVTLSREYTELSAQAARDETRAHERGREAVGLWRGINTNELKEVVAAAQEANSLIDRRTFSWTDLFNRIEGTLPPDVMLTAIRPHIERGTVTLTVVVLGRRVEDIDRFMEQLEETGTFRNLLSRQEEATDEGLYRAVLQGQYLGGAGKPQPEKTGAATPQVD